MRPFLALVLLVAATAGCLQGPEESAGDGRAPEAPATPDGVSPAPPASEPAAPTPATASPSAAPPAPEPAPAPAPKKVYEATFDFASQGDATGQSPKSQPTAPVQADHRSVRIELTLARSSATPGMVPVSGTLNSPTVRILDPQGNEVLAVSEEGAVDQQVPAVPGEWTVQYAGAGTLRATLVLTALG